MSFRPRPKYNSSSFHTLKKLDLNQAKQKIMDLVARRDHSEKELRQKLKHRCETEVLDLAIQWAVQQSWFVPPEILNEKFAAQLSRRGKGIRQINQKLKNIGLSPVKADKQTELENAKRLVLNKWSSQDFKGLNYKETMKLKTKIIRYLASRGYEQEIIKLVLDNEFKAGVNSYDEEH